MKHNYKRLIAFICSLLVVIHCSPVVVGALNINDNSIVSTTNDIIIVSQPVDCEIYNGEKASFSVEATGVGLTYQWYYRNANTTDWILWSGKTTATITTGTASSSRGRQVCCVITDETGATVETEPATIVFKDKLSIESQPVDCEIYNGEKASFSVEATGVGLTYQWYYRNANTTDWSVISDCDSQYISVFLNNGSQVMCRISDKYGEVIDSSYSTVNIKSAISILSQPMNVYINKGDKASFNVVATGKELKYQWYYRNSGTTEWSIWVGKTSSELITTTYNSSKQRDVYCEIMDADGNIIKSDVATMFFI